MRFKRIKMLWKRQEGMALAMVMIIFMVIAVLGAIVATLSLAEVQQSVALDRDMRAYYQARSAADATTYWIRNELLVLNDVEDAYMQLEESLNKIEDELAAETLLPEKVSDYMSKLATAVGNYDEGADLEAKAGLIREIAYYLDAMSYIPEGATGGPLVPATAEELNSYIADAYAAQSDAENDYDERLAFFKNIVKDTEGEINYASIDNSEVIAGVPLNGIEVQRINMASQETGHTEYIYTRASATVDGVSSAAVVRLNETLLGEMAGMFSDAIYAASDINGISGNSFEVNGRVSYGGTCEDIKFPENINIGPEKNDATVYPDWNPPGNLTVKKWPVGGSKENKAVALTSGAYSGNSQADGYYSINPAGGDVILYVDNLDLSEPSQIKVYGTGNVYLFIDAITDPGKKIQLKVYSPTTAPTYLIFDKTVSLVNWTGSCQVDAYIYAPNAVVDIGGGTIVNGAIITNNFVSANGNFTVNYRSCAMRLFGNDGIPGGNEMCQWLKEEQWPEPE
jgi:hypothetical protein